jgi:hypothetical protein
MPSTLPIRPNIDQLKRQAKDLLRDYHAGDQAAQQLVALHLPASAPQPFRLSGAQLVIARAYGFGSWLRLVDHVKAVVDPPTRQSGREAARLARLARRAERQRRIAELAERLVTAARQPDPWALFKELAIGRYEGGEVRAYLVANGGFEEIVGALLRASDHPNARLRFLAAQAMDHFADQRCAAPLRRMLGDPVPRMRWAAIHSLRCDDCKLTPLEIADDTITALIALARYDPSVKVRRVAAYELGQICADQRVLGALAAIAAEDADIICQRIARAALAQHGEREPGGLAG